MGKQAVDHSDTPKEHKEEEEEEGEEEEEENDNDGDDDDDDDNDEDEYMYFRPVLSGLDLEKLAQIATIVRLRQEHGESAIHSSLDEFLKMTCKMRHRFWVAWRTLCPALPSPTASSGSPGYQGMARRTASTSLMRKRWEVSSR